MSKNEQISYRGHRLTVVPSYGQWQVNISCPYAPDLPPCKAPDKDAAVARAKECVNARIGGGIAGGITTIR